MIRYPEHPAVGVGGIVLKEDSILLVRRGNPPSKGQWGVPGGVLELGESVKAGVAREVKEETGIEVEVGDLVEIFEVFQKDPWGATEFHYVLLDYLCYYVSGELQAGDDADECQFIPFDKLSQENLSPAVEELVECLKKRGIC